MRKCIFPSVFFKQVVLSFEKKMFTMHEFPNKRPLKQTTTMSIPSVSYKCATAKKLSRTKVNFVITEVCLSYNVQFIIDFFFHTRYFILNVG